MKMEKTECSETSAYKIQKPENYPEESIQHSKQGESLNEENLAMFVSSVCVPSNQPDVGFL
jgi:NADPH-dependent 7-cyano-7-deazaguanine reductase QueF